MKKLFLTICFLSVFCRTLNAFSNTEKSPTIELHLDNPDWISEVEHLTPDILDSLKAEGFDFSAKDSKGNTLFYYVLTKNPHPELIQKLLNDGVDVNLPAANGLLPLNVATSKANEIQLQVLMLKTMGVDIYASRIKDSLEQNIFNEMNNMLALAKTLLKAGADVNKQSPLGTPLMNASTNAWNIDIVKLLIDSGADLNALDKNGRTALFYAALAGNTEIIDTLLQAGADPNIKDDFGKTYSDILRLQKKD